VMSYTVNSSQGTGTYSVTTQVSKTGYGSATASTNFQVTR
jgi:hypothetical protein